MEVKITVHCICMDVDNSVISVNPSSAFPIDTLPPQYIWARIQETF